MPIESADDLAAFFNPEEFGEAIAYNGVGGCSAIWIRPSEAIPFGDTQVIADTNIFCLPASTIAAPAAGEVFTIVRTGAEFAVMGEPRRSRDGSLWMIEVEPA